MIIVKKITICVLILFAIPCYSQSLIQYQGETFKTGETLYMENDTITFVYSKSKFSKEKRNLIFLQGSLPMPILFEINDTSLMIFPLNNFKIKKLTDKYNVFVLSKPFTPLRKKITELNDQYCYVPDTSNPYCYDTNYQKTNNLVYTANRISFFVNFISGNYKSNDSSVILIGHSQGGIEASRVSAINNKITNCVVLSTNPFGRVFDYILSNRINYEKGFIDSAEYHQEKNGTYNYWKKTITNPDDLSCEGDPSKTTISFSNSLIPNLIKTKANVYFGIGSLDAGSYLADLIPLYFIQKNKTTPTIKIFEGVDHNYFPPLENGNPDYKNGKWDFVMNDVINWLELNN